VAPGNDFGPTPPGPRVALAKVMIRRALLVLGLAGCSDPTSPSPLHPSYYLVSIDGDLLPAAPAGWPAGSEIEAATLFFRFGERPRRGSDAAPVRLVERIRKPDQTTETSTTDLQYRIVGGLLRIDLCPVGALCVVSQELVGPVDPLELVLTEYVGGTARSVYRFGAVLPE
jgi:hypothetical protein